MLHHLGEERQLPVNLAHPLAAIEIIAVLGAIPIARRPADDGGDLRALGAEQVVIACTDGGEASGGDGVGFGGDGHLGQYS